MFSVALQNYRLVLETAGLPSLFETYIQRARLVDQIGFWGWSRHGSMVLMSAELELAAWTADGIKLWSTFVEPPWSYAVEGDQLTLDVMGDIRSFPLLQGPDIHHRPGTDGRQGHPRLRLGPFSQNGYSLPADFEWDPQKAAERL